MARPQVHGYNMSSVAMLSSLSFVSSAEEKVIRAFQAPYNFLENMSQLSKINFDSVGKYSFAIKNMNCFKLYINIDSVIFEFNNIVIYLFYSVK